MTARGFPAWCVAAALGVCAAASPARAETVSTSSYAIVIGNNAPPASQAELGALRYADDDAVRYYQYFSRIGQATLLTVLDKPTQRRYPGLAASASVPTLEELDRAVATIAKSMAADRQRGIQPVFYFVFSGHGARDEAGTAFLAMHGGALTDEGLYGDIIDKLPSSYSHLLIDACHAGGVVGVRGDFFQREADATSVAVTASETRSIFEAGRLDEHPHVGVLLATTLGQEAHEWSEVESGVFSHELLSGLAGPADVNGDGLIEYTEIQAFVAAANRGVRDPRAVPRVIARPPKSNQNAALVSLPTRGVTQLHGPFATLGRFHVELDSGQRYLDAHLADGAGTRILLPATEGAYLRTDTAEARIAPGRGRAALADLVMKPRAIGKRGSVDHAYRTSLFASPFGKVYYQGYVEGIGAIGVNFAEPEPEPHRVVSAKPAAPEREGGRLAYGVAALAGVSAVASITTTVFAMRAKDDFDATDRQRPAQEAKQRYERNRNIAVATGILAVVGGVAAWQLWPDASARIQPEVGADGSGSVTFEMSW